MGICFTHFLGNVTCGVCFTALGLCVHRLKLGNLKGAVIQEWAGWWVLVTVLWVLEGLRKGLQWLLDFFLLLLSTEERVFDQREVFSQKKRTALPAVPLPWQWTVEALARVIRVFPAHPLCSCSTAEPLLRKGWALSWAGRSAAEKGQRGKDAAQGTACPRCHWPCHGHSPQQITTRFP